MTQYDPRSDPQPDPASTSGPVSGSSPASGGSCQAGLFGKLPARGDFVTRNIPSELLRPFEDWLMAAMRDARALLDQAWTQTWLHAPAWRFWIGGAALDGDWRHGFQGRAAAVRAAAVTGVLLPSADRLGRHFPLVILLADRNAHLMPPPVLGHADRDWYAACERLLHAARQGAELAEIEAGLAALPAPRVPAEWAAVDGLLERRSLWAVGEGAAGPDHGYAQGHDPGAAAWADIRAIDHHLAAVHRSYWWREPLPGRGGPFAALALPGLPDADSFAFMLGGALPEPGMAPEPEPEPETAPETGPEAVVPADLRPEAQSAALPEALTDQGPVAPPVGMPPEPETGAETEAGTETGPGPDAPDARPAAQSPPETPPETLAETEPETGPEMPGDMPVETSDKAPEGSDSGSDADSDSGSQDKSQGEAQDGPSGEPSGDAAPRETQR